jgi:flagellar biosynthesis protein FlhF
MGPTGVGKTTTTAKLAARCVVRYGAERVALLTTDTYRIGAHEQLRLYARILGLSVHAICDETDLRAVLGDLSGRHIVLIDTVGMSQRDRRVSEHVGMLCGAGSVNRVLLLSACGSADSLDETVRAYRGTESLAGVVLTKIDEAVSLGGAVDVVVRHRLKLHYLTNGQRVPEDLHAPNREYLLHRALSQRPAEAAYAVQDSDVPGLLGMARVAPAAAATMVRT